MPSPWPVVAVHLAVAAVLVLAARVASLVTRRQAVVHACCLLALIKLVTPPLLPLRLLPGTEAAGAAAAGAAHGVEGPARQPATRHVETGAELAAAAVPLWRPPLQGAVPARAAALLAPSLGILGVAVFRFVRFGRSLPAACPAPAPLRARVDALSHAVGLRRPPEVRLVDAPLPPLVWPALRGAVLVLPQALLRQLEAGETDALVAHELAHLRRRDHWVRFVEIAATALFWWYPVTWWARALLRRAEERCCDERVMRLLPDSARSYASGLVKCLAFASEAPSPVPLAASGAGPVRDLEARLEEILMKRPLPPLPKPTRVALASAAVAGLLVFPAASESRTAASGSRTAASVAVAPATAGDGDAIRNADVKPALPARVPARPAARPAIAAAVDAAPGDAAVGVSGGVVGGVPSQAEDPALAAERRAIERQRADLHVREIELERRTAELETRAERQQLTAEAARARAEGRPEDAARSERRIELSARRLELQKRQLQLELDRTTLDRDAADGGEGAEPSKQGMHEAKQRELEAEMEKNMHAMEALDSEQRVEDLRASGDELRASLADRVRELREAAPAAGAGTPALEQEIARLEAALAALEGDGPRKMRRSEPVSSLPRKSSRPQP